MPRIKESAAVQQYISWRRILSGSFIGLLTILLLLFAMTFLVSNGTLPWRQLHLFVYTAAAAGGLVAAFVGCGRRKKLFSALIIAALLVLILFLLGTLIFSDIFSVKTFVMVLIILTFSCMMGSVISSLLK